MTDIERECRWQWFYAASGYMPLYPSPQRQTPYDFREELWRGYGLQNEEH